MGNVYLVLGAIALAFNVVASVLVLRAKFYDRAQKRNQLALIWLLPMVGSVLCLFVIRETSRSAKRSSNSTPPSESIPGIGSHFN